MSDRLIRIVPVARHYAWGSRTAIPALLGEAPSNEPVAELWFGAHPDSPSTSVDGGLDELIRADPRGELGAVVADRFGDRLPFLLKILAADHALSIQVHPTLAEARAGFADEQARGVPADAPNRNYRDANHKPELLCALTDFDALCGFRPIAATLELLSGLDTPALDPLRACLAEPDPLRAAMSWLLDRAGDAKATLLADVAAACRRVVDTGGDWQLEAQAVLLAAADFPGDIGAVMSLLLNAVRLAPGEAIFLGAGTVHAYLRGVGVELMANSDNVLRCGLTPKHVDVAEVMRIADFSPLAQPRCEPIALGPLATTPVGLAFPVPVPDFELSIIDLTPGRLIDGQLPGPQILLCGAGVVTVDGLELAMGQAAFVAAGRPIGLTGSGRIYRATCAAAGHAGDAVTTVSATELAGPVEPVRLANSSKS